MRIIFFILIILSAVFSVFSVNSFEDNPRNIIKIKETKTKEISGNTIPQVLKNPKKINIKSNTKVSLKDKWPQVNTSIEDYELDKKEDDFELETLPNTITDVKIDVLMSTSNMDSQITQRSTKSIYFKDSKTIGISISKKNKFGHLSYKHINNQTLLMNYYDILGGIGIKVSNEDSVEFNVLRENMVYLQDERFYLQAPIMAGIRYEKELIDKRYFKIRGVLESMVGDNKASKNSIELGFLIPIGVTTLESSYKRSSRQLRVNHNQYIDTIKAEDNELSLNLRFSL